MTYAGTSHSWDRPAGLVIDSLGNVYVTGVAVELGTRQDFVTVKYAAAGNEMWVATYNGPDNWVDTAHAITIDSSDNVYVTGSSFLYASHHDYLTIKYDSDGNPLWIRRYDGPGNGFDVARDIAVDASGNVYVTGSAYSDLSREDCTTIKYSPSGTQLWVRHYNGPGNQNDQGFGLALDSLGNVYVTGRGVGAGTNTDFATVKYDGDGNELWVRRYTSEGWGRDEAWDIAADDAGHVYVTGFTTTSGTTPDWQRRDVLTLKYDAAGNEIWARQYNGSANLSDEGQVVGLDSSGNVLVTGFGWGPSSSNDFLTLKYDSAGNNLWIQNYNGPVSGLDMATEMAIGGDGHIYVTGVSEGGETGRDFATVKYSPAGESVWVKRLHVPGNLLDHPKGIGVDGAGSVYVTGYTYRNPWNSDYVTVKYVSGTDADGDGVPDGDDNCISVANAGQVDTDADTLGDLCDVCPADPLDACDTGGSTAGEISADQGGSVQTPDGAVTIDVDPGDLAADETISVTQTVFNDPAADLALSLGLGKGQRISVYDLHPEGLVFNSPVTLTIVADVSGLNASQRAELDLYRDTGGSLLEPIPGASCSVAEEPPGSAIYIATCTAELEHFSVYALAAPLDTDGDGIFDLFDGIEDICPDGPNVVQGFLPPMVGLVPDEEPEPPLPDTAFQQGRTVPLKLDYLCGSVPVTDQDDVTAPELLGVWLVGAPEPLAVIDPDTGEASDSGIWFRYSDDHWIYNLDTGPYGPGTYEVKVKLPDGRTFKGGFVLR